MVVLEVDQSNTLAGECVTLDWRSDEIEGVCSPLPMSHLAREVIIHSCVKFSMLKEK